MVPVTPGPKPVDPLIRVMRKVVKRDDGCWIFTGYTQPFGHGMVNLGAKKGKALTHRLVYERLVGPVPAGLELDHLCRVPSCCNPEHLEPVTHRENVRRGNCSTVQTERFASMKTCRQGHARNSKNTYLNKDGRRRCRPCSAQWARDNRKAKK